MTTEQDPLDNNFDREEVYPLAALQREEVREELKAADLVFGHDEAQGGKPVLFFGRELLEQIAAIGQGRPCRTFRISYDQRTDQLEYLIAAVEVLKGSHCYQASGPPPRVETWQLPDGTLETRTNDTDPYFAEARAKEDAELQRALDYYRSQGLGRAVLFHVGDDSDVAAATWRKLEPVLTRRGLVISSAGLGPGGAYVTHTNLARKLLRPLLGKQADRLFRTPRWPLSYWTARTTSRGIVTHESRTFKDEAKSEGT
jgi:hypothetical protein